MVDQPARELADDDLARPCQLLELRGDADCLAGDESLPRVGRCRDDLARLETNADLQPDAVVRGEVFVEGENPGPDVECRACCAKRVVLVRDGNTEGGHHGIAGVLLDGTTVPRDGCGDRLEVALQDASERLGVERVCECHRLDDVDEEDRDEPPELHRRLGERRVLEQQRLVLAQDCCLEAPELRPGLDPELVDKRLARVTVGRERIRLPPGAVERQHELAAGTFAKRLRLRECLELGDQTRVAAEGKVRFDPLLEHDRPELLEPRDLGLRERLIDEICERRPSPEGERFAQCDLGGFRAAGLESISPVVRGSHEAMEVHALRGELERVARRASDDDRSERLSELRDVHLNGMRSGLGCLARPEGVDKAIDRHHAAEIESKHRKQRARLGAADPNGSSLARHLEGTEQAELEHSLARRVAPLARAAHITPLVPSATCSFARSSAGVYPTPRTRPLT